MTTDELRNAILDDMTNEYYGSNLCQIVDGNELMGNYSKSTLEEAVFELIDDLSHSIIEAMEDNGVLKKKVPV